MSKNQFKKLVIQHLYTFLQKNMGDLLQGGLLNITELKISPDWYDAYCKVSWLPGSNVWGEEELLRFLQAHKATIKHALAQSLARSGLKKMPTLHFQVDRSERKGVLAEKALEQVLGQLS